ncbi:MAG: MBL fold metallo-hydrolase [Chloroflexi bacterium]|nr:MBL fold metallo-hydrolase [Chloroflexota bacterium]
MKLTILGQGASCPNPGGACSGYLVEEDDTHILLDCGSGVVSQLRRVFDYRRVSAIIISHMHADHFLDLIPYTYGLRIGSGLWNGFRPLLLLPPNGQAVLDHVTSPWPDLAPSMASVFRIGEYEVNEPLQIGSLRVEFTPTRHYIPANAINVLGGSKLSYSSDTGPADQLTAHAQDADLFLCEASLRERHNLPGEEGHLTARDAGEIASKASVRKLVLTHFFVEFGLHEMLQNASAAFPGPIELAETRAEYVI